MPDLFNNYTSPELEDARATRVMLWGKATRGEIDVHTLYRLLGELRAAAGDDLYPRQVFGRQR